PSPQKRFIRSICAGATPLGFFQSTFMFMSITMKFRNISTDFISPRLRNNCPVWIQPVWVENAERASIILVSDFWENIIEQDCIAVAFIHRDILAIFSDPSEILNPLSIQVD